MTAGYAQQQDLQFCLPPPAAEGNLTLLLIQVGKNLQMALMTVSLSANSENHLSKFKEKCQRANTFLSTCPLNGQLTVMVENPHFL